MLKKAHRLLLPMLFFGIIYYFCFFFNTESFFYIDFLMKILNGCGHLWFLPMLFWCQLLLWVLVHYKFDGKLTLAFLALLSIIVFIPLPLGLSTVSHYAFYAFLGYYLYKRKDLVYRFIQTNKYIIPVLWLLYIALVLLVHSPWIASITCTPLVCKAFLYLGRGVIGLFACISGIFAMYGTVSLFTSSGLYELKPLVKKADRVSFGIYIYHQFLLVALYHYTPMVSYINVWVLPWMGFLISYIVSWLITALTLKTRIGRFLIG